MIDLFKIINIIFEITIYNDILFYKFGKIVTKILIFKYEVKNV